MGEGIHRVNVGGPNGATLDTSNPFVAVAGMVLVVVAVLGTVKNNRGHRCKTKRSQKLR